MSETVNVSVYISREMAVGTRARAKALGERLSDTLCRYAEEGDRAETHPEIVFRSGPAGRRAGLAGGPEVWEIVLALCRDGDGAEASERLAEEMSITTGQVAVALRYAAEFPEKIEARIGLYERETAHCGSLASR